MAQFKKSSDPKFKRVRPLLGTFVEIGLAGASTAQMNAAANRAFAIIAKVDGLMSFHKESSDLSLINRARAHEWVSVHAHTRKVLAMANIFFRTSNGVFDVRRGATAREKKWAPVEIAGRRVRKSGAFVLDLGGIAKGYAVDLAVVALKRAGIKSGLVNAGGDLRAFGSEEWPIAVRHPASPGATLALFPLKSGALATSGAYFSRRSEDREWNSALKKRSVTVVSPTCMLADGLTKIVALAPKTAPQALRQYRSHAFVIGANGILQGVN
jgi:thiamine biosynthesis lipoprotein